MDPNTLNLDPDQRFWPNLVPDPGLYCTINFERKIENTVSGKKYFLSTLRTKCHQQIFLLSSVSEFRIYILNLTPFYLHLSHIYMCGFVFGIRIRIQKAPEYGSGFTTLVVFRYPADARYSKQDIRPNMKLGLYNRVECGHFF